MNQRAKTEVICLGVLLAIYVSLGIRNLPLLINDKKMILFLIILSVISSLAIQLLVKIGWKKSTYETKMCEILARDIKIYTHITLAVVIRLFLYIYLSVQGDINMYMRINSICSN